MSRTRKRYSSQLKFQVVDIATRVVLEALTGEKTPGQIAKAYGVHLNSISLWKRTFLERGRRCLLGMVRCENTSGASPDGSGSWGRRRS